MNRIVEVKLTLVGGGEVPGTWEIAVTKEFAPEHGGGAQVFTENGGPQLHRALDVAREMVTVSPGRRTDSAVTHTLDWEHIWPDGSRSEVRLYLNRDGEDWAFVDAQRIAGNGLLLPLLSDIRADVRQSFEDNRDTGYDFEHEAKEVQRG